MASVIARAGYDGHLVPRQKIGYRTTVPRPTRIAVLGCSGVSTGELTLAFDWLGRCERPLEVHALVSEHAAAAAGWAGATVHQWPAVGGRVGAEQIEAQLEAIAPDAVLIADLLLLYVSSPEFGRFFRRSSNLLVPVLERARARSKLLALDLYDWDANGRHVDLLGSAAATFVATVPEGVGRLMPSPYLTPRASSPGRGRYAMMADGQPASKRAKQQTRRALGVGNNKIVFIATSPWQHNFASNPRGAATTQHYPLLVARLLDQVAARVGGLTLIHLGPAPLPPAIGLEALEYRHVPQIPPAQFRGLLGAADLVLAANCIATTNVRAASLRVPVATVHLSKAVPTPPKKRSRTAAEAALADYLAAACPTYACSVWPLGLHRLMRGVLARNPFKGIQAHLDAFAPNACVDRLQALLADPGTADALRQAQSAYFERLAADTDTPEVALDAALAA